MTSQIVSEGKGAAPRGLTISLEYSVTSEAEMISAIDAAIDWHGLVRLLGAARATTFKEELHAYWSDPDVRGYVSLRRKYPEVEIAAEDFDSSRELWAARKRHGIPIELEVQATMGRAAAIEELSLRLLELSLTAPQERASGKTGREALIRYLAVLMIEGIQRGTPGTFPRSLVVLLRHVLCGDHPEYFVAGRSGQRRSQMIDRAAQIFGPNEVITERNGVDRLGVSRKIMRRWLDSGFANEVAQCQKASQFWPDTKEPLR